MERLSDEEKAGLQARIEQERRERIHRVSDQYKYERRSLTSAGFGRIIGEFLAGGTVGIAGAVVPFLMFSTGESEDWGGFFAMFCVVPITYPLGSAIPVYLVGSIGKKTGAFSVAALGGSILGAFIGASLGWVVLMVGPGVFGSWGLPVAALLAAPVGATVGFNLTRRYSSRAS